MSGLLQASVTGAILIAVVALLRLCFGKQLSRSVFLVLWLLAALRLLLPVSLPSPTSIYNLPLFAGDVILAPAEQQAPPVEQRPVVQLPPVQQPAAEVPDAPVILPPAEQDSGLSLPQLLTLIWAVVGFSILLTVELRHLLNRRRYRFHLPLPESTDVPAGLRVRMLEGLSSPLTYGLFRPTVLVPVRSVSQPEQLRHILLHEQAHIRYGDLWKKQLFLLVACVHWFNPLVWLMLALAFEDMEIRCDAVAVGKLGAAQKKSYALTLVSAETARLNDLLQSGFSHSTTARRLKALIHLRRRPAISAVVCICLVVILSLGLLTGPVTASARAELSAPPETLLQPSAEQPLPPLTQPGENDEEENLPATERPDTTAASTEAQTEALTAESTAAGSAALQATSSEWEDGSSATISPPVSELGNDPKFEFIYQPAERIEKGESTSVKIYVSHSALLYTDHPEVISVSSRCYTDDTPEGTATTGILGTTYGWTQKADAAITGLSPGTATIYAEVGGQVFTLATVTVTAPETSPAAPPGSEMDSTDVHMLFLQSRVDVRINRQPEPEIQVLDSTRCALFVTGYGSFYTDRPDVIQLEGESHAIEWWTYDWGPGPFYGASVTVTGLMPGTATVYYKECGKVFTLFTVTVVERQVLVVESSEPIPLPGG